MLDLLITCACVFQGVQDLPPVRVGAHVFHRRQLTNGLRAVAVQDDNEKASVFMVIGAGKRQETPETTGLAHLTEHAMYAGTAKTGLGKHDRLIHAMGGESNAFTREDYTLFYDHLIPVEQLGKVLAMEADRLRGLTFDEKAVLFERERLRREESRTWQPSDARRELLESHAYRAHPYRAGLLTADGHTKAPGLGIPAVRAFYDLYYQPDNTAVVIVSALPPGRALDAVQQAFGTLQRGPERPAIPTEPEPTEPRFLQFAADLQRDRCNFVWLVPEMGHADRPKLDVLAHVLSRNSTSIGPLFEASMGSRVDKELFQVATTGPEATAELKALMQRVREKPQPTDAVSQTVKLLAEKFTSLPLRARPYFSLAGTFGVYEVLGHAEQLAKYEEAVRSVTAADLQAVANRYLSPTRQFTLKFKSSGVAAKPLPDDPRQLQRAAEEAESAGELDRAIAAYTRLLDAGPNKMFQVIYLSSRGQIYVKKQDFDGAIADYEAALRVIDYPAVRTLLKEAKERKANQQPEQPKKQSADQPTSKPTPRRGGG